MDKKRSNTSNDGIEVPLTSEKSRKNQTDIKSLMEANGLSGDPVLDWKTVAEKNALGETLNKSGMFLLRKVHETPVAMVLSTFVCNKVSVADVCPDAPKCCEHRRFSYCGNTVVIADTNTGYHKKLHTEDPQNEIVCLSNGDITLNGDVIVRGDIPIPDTKYKCTKGSQGKESILFKVNGKDVNVKFVHLIVALELGYEVLNTIEIAGITLKHIHHVEEYKVAKDRYMNMKGYHPDRFPNLRIVEARQHHLKHKKRKGNPIQKHLNNLKKRFGYERALKFAKEIGYTGTI